MHVKKVNLQNNALSFNPIARSTSKTQSVLIGTILFLFCHFSGASAETIYQWSDPWGQIQYSKTPVPGAMISDLTELPELPETTSQQKQDAMVRKLHEMSKQNLKRAQEEAMQHKLKTQALETKNYCMQLRNLLTDIQLARAHQFTTFGTPTHSGYEGHLYYNLLKEIHNKCR